MSERCSYCGELIDNQVVLSQPRFILCLACHKKKLECEDQPDDDSDDDRCPRCGGEGHVEYDDAPETWGEDCPSEVNHLVDCPECGGEG